MNRNLFAAAAIVALVGCSSGGPPKQDSAPPVAAPPPSSTAAATPGPGKSWPGMNEKGEVISAHDVEMGHGKAVKVDDLEGEILGIPAPGSKFPQLQIGMGMKQVTDITGPPTDQGAYITGKAFIPFYFGGDKHRIEYAYKGWGRLVFAGGSFGDYSGRLIWIINSAKESGYR
jgi:hypothetical protein